MLLIDGTQNIIFLLNYQVFTLFNLWVHCVRFSFHQFLRVEIYRQFCANCNFYISTYLSINIIIAIYTNA